MTPEDKRKKIDGIRQELKNIQRHFPAEDKKARALVVTEAIRSGNSLSPITESLRQEGVDFDIAAVGLEEYYPESDETQIQYLQKKFGTNVHYGARGAPLIIHASEISGVEKSPADVHAKKYVGSTLARANPPQQPFTFPWQKRPSSDVLSQRQVNQVRADAKIVAENILDNYRQHHHDE